MRPFAYRRAADERDALEVGSSAGAAFVAGATDLLPLWQAGVALPELVIDISRLPLDAIERQAGGVVIGALARLGDVAECPAIRNDYPMIAEALLASASPQVRNVATIGGNLLQRTRCAYFRNQTLPCNKRQAGAGCGALAGEKRLPAIFGASEDCAATHAFGPAAAAVGAAASRQPCR